MVNQKKNKLRTLWKKIKFALNEYFLYDEFLGVKKVTSVSDGVARVSGLMGAKPGERVKLSNTQIEGTALSEEITPESIHFFDKSTKVKNDFYTRKRELIIYNILKSEIPVSFYKDSRWFQLKEGLFKIMSEFIPYHIITKNYTVKLDFKFNVQNIKSYPQIIDIRSDQLGDFCYATYYYNYSGIKKKYKTDLGFKKKNQALVRESIKSYIKVVNLDIIKINEIIIKINKIYLLCIQKIKRGKADCW